MSKSSTSNSFTQTIWGFFASVKLTVVILLSLAVTSIIGTVIPQNKSPMEYVNHYGKSLYSIFNKLDMFDMYHSTWFRFLLCLLIINIVICSIKRLKATWKIIFPKTPMFQPNRFKKSANRQEWVADSSVETVKELCEPYMASHFAAHRVDSAENGFLFFGEKGRKTRLGVYAVHFSVLLMVAGGLIGSIFGFDGYANIPEGQSTSQVTLINKNVQKDLGFAIRCNNFFISFYDSGMPKEYRSNLTILKNGKDVLTKDIRVNDPLRYGGISIFQASYGTIPGKSFTVNFTERDTGMEYREKGSFGQKIQMPGDAGILIVYDFQESYSFRGIHLDNVYLCHLVPKSGEPEQIILPVDYPKFDTMRGGKFIISIQNSYFTGLQITKDPGVGVVYAGFILMIIGCYITFFMHHEQFCIDLSARGNKTRIAVSGVSGKNRPGMLAKTKHLAKHLEKISKNQKA